MNSIRPFAFYLAVASFLLFSCNTPEQKTESSAAMPADTLDETPVTPLPAEKHLVMIVSHHVRNFDSWDTSFHSAKYSGLRDSAQLEIKAIYRDLDDRKHVSVMMKAGEHRFGKKLCSFRKVHDGFKTAGRDG